MPNLGKILENLTDMILPALCSNCRDPVSGKNILCRRCSDSVIIRHSPTRFAGTGILFSATDYADPSVRGLLKELKYNGLLAATDPLVEMTVKHLTLSGFISRLPQNKDIFLVPIPVHMVKKWKRGFDQAEEMAKIIGKELSIPVVRALKRRKWTLPQSDIKDNDFRKINIKECFSLTEKSKIIPRKSAIIIFDDIVTSGATMKEAERTIRSLRPSKIFFVSVASR